MILISFIPILVCALGLLIYLLAKANAELKELGRLAFFAGLLIALLVAANHVVRVTL